MKVAPPRGFIRRTTRVAPLRWPFARRQWRRCVLRWPARPRARLRRNERPDSWHARSRSAQLRRGGSPKRPGRTCPTDQNIVSRLQLRTGNGRNLLAPREYRPPQVLTSLPPVKRVPLRAASADRGVALLRRDL